MDIKLSFQSFNTILIQKMKTPPLLVLAIASNNSDLFTSILFWPEVREGKTWGTPVKGCPHKKAPHFFRKQIVFTDISGIAPTAWDCLTVCPRSSMLPRNKQTYKHRIKEGKKDYDRKYQTTKVKC
jgi:hypothetical protein